MKSETNQHASSEVIDKPAHYPEIDPWKLQEYMEAYGDVVVDARRCDAMKYLFRKKDGWLKDLIKSRNCINAAISRVEKLERIDEIKIGDTVEFKDKRVSDDTYKVYSFYEKNRTVDITSVNHPSNQVHCVYISSLTKIS